jgi:hypothetical protein
MATDRRRLRIAITVMFLLYGGLQLYAVAKADAALAGLAGHRRVGRVGGVDDRYAAGTARC